jgi:hypothetical protein
MDLVAGARIEATLRKPLYGQLFSLFKQLFSLFPSENIAVRRGELWRRRRPKPMQGAHGFSISPQSPLRDDVPIRRRYKRRAPPISIVGATPAPRAAASGYAAFSAGTLPALSSFSAPARVFAASVALASLTCP